MRLFIVAPFGSSYVRDPGWVSPSTKLSVHIRMAPTIDRDHSLRDYCWAAAAAALRRAHAALLASDRADPDLSLLPGFRPPTFSPQTFSPASFLAASAALTRSDLRVLSCWAIPPANEIAGPGIVQGLERGSRQDRPRCGPVDRHGPSRCR